MNKKYVILAIASLLIAAGAVIVGTQTEEAEAQIDVEREEMFRIMRTAPGPAGKIDNPYSANWPEGAGWPDDDFLNYERLAVADAEHDETIPWLAEDWEFVDDGQVFEIRIREEAHWGDGSDLTAEDVKFSLETQWDDKYAGTPPTVHDNEVQIVDDYTVRIEMDEGEEYNRMAMNSLVTPAIVPKSRWNEEDGLLAQYDNKITTEPVNMNAIDDGRADEIIGSGPYRPVYYDDDSVVMERRDDYWGNELGRYFLPEYVQTYFYGSNQNAINTGYQEYHTDWGQVGWYDFDWHQNQPDDRVMTYNKDAANVDEMFNIEATYMVVAGNLKDEVISDETVRIGLQLATDQSALSEYAFGGAGVENPPSHVPMEHPDYSSLVNENIVEEVYPETERNARGQLIPAYSPEAAVELWEEDPDITGSVEDGWELNGEEIGGWEVTSPSGWDDSNRYCEELAATWEEDLGIDVSDETPVQDEWITQFSNFDHDWTFKWVYLNQHGPAPVANSYYQTFIMEQTSINDSGIRFDELFEDEYDELLPLVEQLYRAEPESDDYYDLVEDIQEVIVPLQTVNLGATKPNPETYITRRWVNQPKAEDPRPHLQTTPLPTWQVFNTFSRDIVTEDFSVPGEVEPGETIKAEVTVTNEGDGDQNYAVYLKDGEPEAGADVWEAENSLDHEMVEVPAGETVTVELETAFTEEGMRTLNVDDWRIEDSDPGDPLTATVLVGEENGEPGPGPSPIENADLEAIGDGINSLSEQVNSLQNDVNDLQDQVDELSGLQDSIDDLNDEISDMDTGGGASTMTVIATMIVTIVVVLGGVYALTRE
ncbi:MAG: ABC transporter substrate-binding protein [Candidatus Hadarchaeia archaeon]